jgi:hypothetical protein
MGPFRFTSIVSSASRRRPLHLAVSLLVLWAAPLAAADATDADVANDERSVSTSPLPTHASERAMPATRPPTGPHHRPLTRAASQQRIDSISPLGWLARYGPVDVARRN